MDFAEWSLAIAVHLVSLTSFGRGFDLTSAFCIVLGVKHRHIVLERAYYPPIAIFLRRAKLNHCPMIAIKLFVLLQGCLIDLGAEVFDNLHQEA